MSRSATACWRPTDRLRYSPGSLVVVVGPAAAELGRFADRVVEERGVVLSVERVRELLAGRVSEAEMDERAQALLTVAITKRLAPASPCSFPPRGSTPPSASAWSAWPTPTADRDT